MFKKKVTAAALAAAMMFSAASFAAADENDVEISFRVGDSVLSINGAPVEVETPYVAGEGVTLVPLRVITEAFGATVEWEGETQTITLTYPDVSIVLQIGNIVAQVNDHSETLLEAPALSENGVTMVPLRFISETFGANVSYDSDTSAILVVKEFVDDDNTVTGITDHARTGDSYYGWSIETPKQMTMTDRSLDGIVTTFKSGNEAGVRIEIYPITDDTKSFDERLTMIKDSLSMLTLTASDKGTDEQGNQYAHFQAKNSDAFIDVRHYQSEKYIYDVTVNVLSGASDETKNMALAVSESFKLGEADDVYDLSSITTDPSGNKYRNVTSEEYGLSFLVPADYVNPTTLYGGENEIDFCDAENTDRFVSVGVYSKSADVTAKSLAEQDRAQKVRIFNPDLVKVSEVTHNAGVYQYSYTVSGTEKRDGKVTDAFFEKGDYVYNIAIGLEKDDSGVESFLIDSFNAEELDSSKVGTILRNSPDDTTMTTATVGKYKFEIPASLKAAASLGSQGAGYTDLVTGSAFAISVMSDRSYTSNDVSTLARNLKDSMSENKEYTLVQNVKQNTLNGQKYSYFVFSRKTDYGTGYVTIVFAEKNGDLINITYTEDDVYYDPDGNKIIEHIIETLQ